MLNLFLRSDYVSPEHTTVDRPGDDPRKECEECGHARGSNVRYYPTWKHSPLKDYWLTNAHELLTTEWLKY
jgi:hypothetical protein